ncbi:MAG: DUF11 domain-containing protein [Ignavibacteriae bacterium]|nr:DUF11 domain-containing protein [Ignavibacteriota bacterium]
MSPTPNIKQSIFAALLIVAAAIYALIGIARPPQGTTITNEAVSSFLFKTGQRMIVRSNTTETIVQNDQVAANIDMQISTDALIGNGEDSCKVTALVVDVSGNPVPDGQPVEFWTNAGSFSNGNDTLYTLTVSGRAVVWLRSDMLPSSQPVWVRVGVSTNGIGGQSLSKSLPLVIYAAALRGRIAGAPDRSVQGMLVTIYNQNQERAGADTTDAEGNYLIPISQSGTYRAALSYRTSFGDEITIFGSRQVLVPSSGGRAAVFPLCAIAGNVVDASTGNAIRRDRIPVMLYRTSTNSAEEGRSLPALMSSDERGVFVFDSLSSGSFELLVTDVTYAGRLVVPQILPGTFFIDAAIRLVDAPAMEVAKTTDKRIVEIGDAVTYTVTVRNVSQNSALRNVKLVDHLPTSFVFAANSARTDSAKLPNPTGKRRLEWIVADSLPAGESVRITYTATVGAAALDGDGVNRVYALARDAAGREQRSVEATAQVTVRPGVFTDRGIIIGKIFYDENENARQDEGDRGIPGVELWMEDGTRITTGDEGKYSLPEVRAGQHVMRVNELTLPFGANVLALKVESAEDGISRFVRLTEGGIARVDFYVRRPSQASASALFSSTHALQAGARIPSLYILRFGEIDIPTKISFADTLPAGFSFDYKSIWWRGLSLYPQGGKSNVFAIDFPKRPTNSEDSIYVDIIADSAALGKALSSNGRLVLAYPRNRDAVFPIVQQDWPYATPRFESVAETAKAQPAKSQVVQTLSPDTNVASASPSDVLAQQVADTAKSAKLVVKKSIARRTQKRSTKLETKSSGASIDTASYTRTAEPDQQLATATDRWPLKVEETAIVSALAVIVVLMAFFIWYRRKRNGGGTQ